MPPEEKEHVILLSERLDPNSWTTPFCELPSVITGLEQPEWAKERDVLVAYTKDGIYVVYGTGGFTGPYQSVIDAPGRAQ